MFHLKDNDWKEVDGAELCQISVGTKSESESRRGGCEKGEIEEGYKGGEM